MRQRWPTLALVIFVLTMAIAGGLLGEIVGEAILAHMSSHTSLP